jgi:hypothetical protein
LWRRINLGVVTIANFPAPFIARMGMVIGGTGLVHPLCQFCGF